MPDRVARLIDNETPENKRHGVVPKLAGLLERDGDVDVAFLCDPATVQIFKVFGEGDHFCGYRNIQMLLNSSAPVCSISKLQEAIEDAWKIGINKHGMIETGGITGTRKHIGTSEAQAFFISKKIQCHAAVFSGMKAWKELLDAIEDYLSSTENNAHDSRHIRQTCRSPVFLQRPSHSLTIVGIERAKNGHRKLLVFDPSYRPLVQLGSEPSRIFKRLALYQYRRDEHYLKRYNNFEVLFIDPGQG